MFFTNFNYIKINIFYKQLKYYNSFSLFYWKIFIIIIIIILKIKYKLN